MQEIIGIFGDHSSLPTGMAVVLHNLALGLWSHGARVIYFGRFGQERGFSKEPVMHDDAMSYELVNCEGNVWNPRTVIEAIEHYEISTMVSEDDWFSAGGLVRASMKTKIPLHFITPIDSLPIHSRAYEIFRRCKKVYVPNSAYKQIENGVHLPHGCNFDIFYPEKVEREDVFTFLWIGRDEPRKALGRTIMAFQRIYDKVDCQLWIHSDWRALQAERTARYLRYKRALPVTLSQMEHGSQDKIREIYNSCDVLINSSKAGAHEMTISEGMACNLMPIVTNWTFMNEIYPENGVYGLKCPVENTCGDTVILWDGRRWGVPLGREWGNINIERLAGLMKLCVERYDWVKERGEARRQFVRDNYNWIKISGKLLKEIQHD